MSNEPNVIGGLNDAKSTFQPLKEELYAWRHNRVLYPGWLLAPYQTREKIWNNTKNWLGVAIAANTVWSERQLLVLWRELTWRLGVCLQIVPDEALDTIRRIVDELEDSTHGGVTKETGEIFPSTEGWPRDFAPTAQELQECWLACKLALLQGYRIRPDIEAFEEVGSQLFAMREISVDQRCYVHYQSCLRAMAELDSERTQSLLASWPNQPEDDYWLARKAALLLELGDLPAARRVADDALKRIRGRQQTRHTDYWKLSREGWCLRLLAHVEWLERYSSVGAAGDSSPNSEEMEEWTNPTWKTRFDHRLEAARCSPDAELRALQERVNKRFAPVRPSQRVANPPSFDAGDVSESIRWTMDIPSDRLAPAINLLLASDLTGYSLAGDFGMYAMRWIRDEFPGVWAAFALRFGGIGVTRDPDPSEETKPDSIRRRTLEQLPKQHVERLFSATLQELVRTVERAQVGRDSRMFTLGGGVLTSAARLSDIVTRLSMCLNADARDKLVELLFQAARFSLFRRHPGKQDTIRHLIERSVPYLEREQLKHWFFRILLDLPLDSSRDDQRRGLPNIADKLRLCKVDEVMRSESEEIDVGISQLIEAVGSLDIITRTDAALRLLLLVELKVLSAEEIDAFANIVWKEVDNCGLPLVDDKTISKHVHMSWPEITEGQSVEGLRAWVMSGSVEDRFGDAKANGEEDPNKRSMTVADPGVFLPRLLDLAQRLDNNPEAFEDVFNEGSRNHIIGTILEWWARERDLFGREAKFSVFSLGDVFTRVDLCLRVIFECALGREGPNEKIREGMSGLLNDIEDFRKSSPYKYPIMACIDREGQMAAWDGIRRGLWSSNHDIAYKALIATWQWQRGAKRTNLAPMPANVFTIIVSSIARLDGVVGYHGLWVLRQLIDKECIRVEKEIVEQIVAAVESAANMLVYGSENLGMSVSDEERRSHVRRLLAELIVCLTKRGVAVEPIGRKWIMEAKEDSFVDIRRIAREYSG